MSESNADFWEAVFIICATIVVVFAVIYAVKATCNLICAGRDALRNRYVGGWRLRWSDLVCVPAWLTLELVCFAGAMLCALLVVWIVYDTARSARDWWHAGDRGRR